MLWMDGFDHYGDDETLLTQGAYAEVDTVTLSTLNPRSGTRNLRIFSGNDGGVRRVFGGDFDTVGIGYAFYIPSLPIDSTSLCLAQIRDNANDPVLSIGVTASGQVTAWDGENDTIGPNILRATSKPVILARAYQHFECRVSNSEVEVRINGVTVLSVSGHFAGGTRVPVPTELAQVHIGCPGLANTGFPPYQDVDDLFAWNTEGDTNNDFVGDKKVYTRFTNSDSAAPNENEWDSSVGGSKWDVLNNVPPVDSSYLEANNAGMVQICGVEDFPAEIIAIAGMMVATRVWKADAGNAKVKVSARSGSNTIDGEVHPLSQAPTYFHDPFDVDPATSAAWTVPGLNGVETRIERVE